VVSESKIKYIGNLFEMRQGYVKAIKYEVILLFISALSVLLAGGHFGGFVALAAHLPTSLLTILVIGNVSVNMDQEIWFYLIAAGTIGLHIVIVASILNYAKHHRR